MTWTTVLEQSAWRGTILLAGAFAASWLLRRSSAARRHFVWTAVMAGLMVLPLAMQYAPKWKVESRSPVTVAITQSTVGVETLTGTPAPPAARVPLPVLFWAAGCALTALWFLSGRVRAWWMVRRSAPAGYAAPPIPGLRVLESRTAALPMTCGIWRPAIVLPVEARDWPVERLHTVLLHEAMHIQRRDLLAQAIAQAACCMYWFHPLVWLAARCLKHERERACDDAVVLRGVAAHDYAGHLMVLARALAAKRLPAGAVSMAQPSGLESRIRALLERGRNRQPLSRGVAAAIATAALAVVIPAAAVTAYGQAPQKPQAASPAMEEAAEPVAAVVEQQEAPGSLAGLVLDPSGARVPNGEVKLIAPDGTSSRTMVSDPAGAFQFAGVAAGRYTLEVAVPGFKLYRGGVTLTAGGSINVNALLSVGSVSETMLVSAPRPASAPRPIAPNSAGRIKIGGNVQPCKLIARVPPLYPDDLKAQGITGTVMVEAMVTKQGFLSNIRVINTEINPGLAAAATQALEHWLYQPTLLNGEPVAVLIRIDVTFDLSQ